MANGLENKLKRLWENVFYYKIPLLFAFVVFLIFSFSPRMNDVKLLILSWVGIGAITFFYEFTSSQETEKIENRSNVLKTWLEIILIFTGVFFAYQSDWLDKFFNYRTVNLSGDVQLQYTIPRLSYHESLVFKYTFLAPPKDSLPEIPVVVKAEYGIINQQVELNKKYNLVKVECLNPIYRFPARKLDKTTNTYVKDTVCAHEVAINPKGILSYNPRLIKIDAKAVAICR